MRILIVDDNEADVGMVREIFDSIEGCNYHLSVIDNGNDAVEYLEKISAKKEIKRPHIILLDLNLPGRTGHEILKEMKRLELNIPVIVYTTSDRPEDVKKAYKLHANCYVVKPSDFTQLTRVLRLLGQFWMEVATLPGD